MVLLKQSCIHVYIPLIKSYKDALVRSPISPPLGGGDKGEGGKFYPPHPNFLPRGRGQILTFYETII
jgi:hypothetical protein